MQSDGRWKHLTVMLPFQIELCLSMLDNVRIIQINDDLGDEDGSVIGVYQDSGPNRGLYDTSKTAFKKIICQYNYTAGKREIEEIRAGIPVWAKTVDRCLDPDLVPLNNGNFNYRKKSWRISARNGCSSPSAR